MPKVIDEAIIFRTVIALLVSHGYEGATTKEIAAISGVNEVTLFRKYGSKAIMIEKAIEYQLSNTPLNKLTFTGDLESDLRDIVQAYLDTNHQFGELIPILLSEVARNPELKQSALKLWMNVQVITKIIEQYQDQGMLKKEPALNSANVLLGPLMTSLMFQRANLGLPVPAIDIQDHVNTFLNGKKVI